MEPFKLPAGVLTATELLGGRPTTNREWKAQGANVLDCLQGVSNVLLSYEGPMEHPNLVD